MIPHFMNASLSESDFNRIISYLHRDSLGQPELRKPGRDITKYPVPDCMCNSSSSSNTGHSSVQKSHSTSKSRYPLAISRFQAHINLIGDHEVRLPRELSTINIGEWFWNEHGDRHEYLAEVIFFWVLPRVSTIGHSD